MNGWMTYSKLVIFLQSKGKMNKITDEVKKNNIFKVTENWKMQAASRTHVRSEFLVKKRRT